MSDHVIPSSANSATWRGTALDCYMTTEEHAEMLKLFQRLQRAGETRSFPEVVLCGLRLLTARIEQGEPDLLQRAVLGADFEDLAAAIREHLPCDVAEGEVSELQRLRYMVRQAGRRLREGSE